jgi:hypothetical protein
VFNGEKYATEKLRKNKKDHAKVSAFQQDIIKFAHEWSTLDYSKDADIETTYLKQPEQSETLQILIDSLGWARKKQPPSVSIPPPIKQELLKLYNIRPNLSAAQSRVRLIAIPEYSNSIYVEYIITEARIHSYFAQLQTMKKTLKLDATTQLVIHQNYKGRLSKGNDLRLEIHRRKINVCVNGKNKQQLIKILLENDRDAAIGQPDEDAIEREYAAEKNAQEEDLVDSDDDESPNLDDPAVLGNFMNDFQA